MKVAGIIENLEDLEALYGDPVPAALTKVVTHLTPAYRRWISASRFVVLTTVGPTGTDGSPRGDDGPVVQIEDDKTILLPDWRGNNRMDSLRNIIVDGRVSLMFMLRGATNVVRVNGRAVVSRDPALCRRFEQVGRHPRTVIVIRLVEAYYQCAKAVMRADLWSGKDDTANAPTAGAFRREIDQTFDAAAYDAAYPQDAKDRMW